MPCVRIKIKCHTLYLEMITWFILQFRQNATQNIWRCKSTIKCVDLQERTNEMCDVHKIPYKRHGLTLFSPIALKLYDSYPMFSYNTTLEGKRQPSE